MFQEKKLIAEPPSRFVTVKCKECENEQVVFASATREVVCNVCGKPLTQPTGGKARILGEVVTVLS